MKTVYRIAVLLIIMIASYTTVFAEEMVEDTANLEVDITLSDGMSALSQSGEPLYTSLPVTFSPRREDGVNYFSISIDDGSSFGSYVKMEDKSVTLYPDDKTSESGRWQIRFANIAEGIQTSSDVYRVCFDVTAPDIKPDDRDITDLIGEDKKVSVAVSDDCALARIIAKCGDEVLENISGFGEENMKEYELLLSITKAMPAEGIIEIICDDIAGNRSCFSFGYFYDPVSPAIHAEGIENGAYLKDDAKLYLMAEDSESGAYVNYVITKRTQDGEESREVTGIRDRAILPLVGSGKYSIIAWATDDAGNRSADLTREFVIDTIAPGVVIGGVSDNVDITSRAKVTVDVTDNVYEDAEVAVTLTRSVTGEREVLPIQNYRMAAVHDVRDIDINSDGEYEVYVCATDKAGNSSEDVKRFRVDSTAPEISISGIKEGEMTNEKSRLRFCAGELFYDSTIMTAVLEKKNRNGYETVKVDRQVMKHERDSIDVNVDSEGEYRLTCRASDRSGNEAVSSVSFAVDYTPPVISGLSKMDNKFFKAFTLPGKIADYVSDSSAVTTWAYLNDSSIADGSTVIEEGRYVLTIMAEDEADNTAEQSVSFIVDHTAPQIVLEGFDRDGNIRKGSIVKVSLLEAGDVLTSVKFNGRNILIDKDNTATIAVNDYGKYTFEIAARDEAGNVTDTQIGTECYMYGGLFGKDARIEKTISVSDVKPDVDIDLKGLLLGLASVLSGTFGLALRTYLRD